MPTIHVTNEQAQALARGENVTIAASPPKATFVVVRKDGEVCTLEGQRAKMYAADPRYTGQATIIRSVKSHRPVGQTWHTTFISSYNKSITEVPA